MAKMDFYRWQDMYHLRKAQAKQKGEKQIYRMEPKDMYNYLADFFMHDKWSLRNAKPGERSSNVISCYAELAWFQHGQPYYKVWPQMAMQLSNISIDISGKYLHLPFPTFEVCLPKTSQIREHADAPPLRSLLVFAVDIKNATHVVVPDREWTLKVHYQFDTVSKTSKDMGWYYQLGIHPDKTIEECFEETWPISNFEEGGYIPKKEFIKGLIKLAIGVAFFGLHEHEVIMPDIPNKFIERFHAAKRQNNKSEAAKLLDKAKRLGHFGWRVGSEIDLPQPIVKHTSGDEGEKGNRGELKFGHVRSGFLRLQPYGKKDEEKHYELIFIPPTTVRPDLPLRDIRGFRIRDSVLERQKEPIQRETV